MANNVKVTPGSAADPPIATDDVGGIQYQRVKIDVGSSGATVPLVPGQAAATSSLPVVLATDQPTISVSVSGAIVVSGAVSVAGHVLTSVEGHVATSVDGTVTVAGAVSVAGTVIMAGAVSVVGTVIMAGAVSVVGHVQTSVDGVVATSVRGTAIVQQLQPARPLETVTVVSVSGASAGNYAIVSAPASGDMRIARMILVFSSATNVALRNGTTALTGPMPIGDRGSIVLDKSDSPWFLVSASNNFIVNVSAGVGINGTVWWY